MHNALFIAKKARRWAMRNRTKYFFKKDLAGMCAIASHYIVNQLPGSYYKMTNNHVWAIYKDYAIDVTATQFNCAPIICCPEPEYKKIMYKYITNDVRSFYDTTSFVQYLSNHHWPRSQMPKPYFSIY